MTHPKALRDWGFRVASSQNVDGVRPKVGATAEGEKVLSEEWLESSMSCLLG
jgi:hypothetical protein